MTLSQIAQGIIDEQIAEQQRIADDLDENNRRLMREKNAAGLQVLKDLAKRFDLSQPEHPSEEYTPYLIDGDFMLHYEHHVTRPGGIVNLTLKGEYILDDGETALLDTAPDISMTDLVRVSIQFNADLKKQEPPQKYEAESLAKAFTTLNELRDSWLKLFEALRNAPEITPPDETPAESVSTPEAAALTRIWEEVNRLEDNPGEWKNPNDVATLAIHTLAYYRADSDKYHQLRRLFKGE